MYLRTCRSLSAGDLTSGDLNSEDLTSGKFWVLFSQSLASILFSVCRVFEYLFYHYFCCSSFYGRKRMSDASRPTVRKISSGSREDRVCCLTFAIFLYAKGEYFPPLAACSTLFRLGRIFFGKRKCCNFCCCKKQTFLTL